MALSLKDVLKKKAHGTVRANVPPDKGRRSLRPWESLEEPQTGIQPATHHKPNSADGIATGRGPTSTHENDEENLTRVQKGPDQGSTRVQKGPDQGSEGP